MAEDAKKKPSGREAFYGKKDSGKKPEAKKEPEKKPAAKKEGGSEGDAGKAERDDIQRRHEVERRQMHDGQRDEHRAMNARHESEHEGADHKGLVALHRKHEAERHAMHGRHQAAMHEMHGRQMAERQAVNQQSEMATPADNGNVENAGSGAPVPVAAAA